MPMIIFLKLHRKYNFFDSSSILFVIVGTAPASIPRGKQVLMIVTLGLNKVLYLLHCNR